MLEFLIKFIPLVTLLILCEITARRIQQLKMAPVPWRDLRRVWLLILLEVAILATWVALAIFDLRPPIDPVRIASSLWKTVSGR